MNVSVTLSIWLTRSFCVLVVYSWRINRIIKWMTRCFVVCIKLWVRNSMRMNLETSMMHDVGFTRGMREPQLQCVSIVIYGRLVSLQIRMSCDSFICILAWCVRGSVWLTCESGYYDLLYRVMNFQFEEWATNEITKCNQNEKWESILLHRPTMITSIVLHFNSWKNDDSSGD